ncbi:MAG: DUF2169 domain-containing protein, partial [Deltaproteobacteria bacterium]
KGTFEIRPGEPAVIAPEQIPITFGDEFYDEKQGGCVKFESDIAPFKPRADIVLVGHAHAPGGASVLALDVSLRVGQVRKTIRVFGDRRWVMASRLLPEHSSKPQPFSSMPLVYERAFGGIDSEGGGFCPENLVGRGFFAKKSAKAIDGSPLPNLEDPNKLIKSWKDHPKPVGFGFYGRAWMPRAGYLGTYDDKWREERSPDPPEDFKFNYYNAAHPDLQVDGYLKGDEEVELAKLTPDGNLRFWLPGVNLACTVTKSFGQEEEELTEEFEEEPDEDFYEFEDEYEEFEEAEEPALTEEEVKLNLDTLCFIPDEKRFYLVWRGLCPIKDLTALEVKIIEIE